MNDNRNGSLKIVIVGHVDHGKSTLIGRLLMDNHGVEDDKVEAVKAICRGLNKEFEPAFLLDSLREEREKEMTIDTTQLHFSTGKRRYTIIDAPGHKEFIKNMVTGAAQADHAMLIVDVTEGMKEQTRRHAYLLHLLGIKEIMVLINKMDRVGYAEGPYGRLKEELIAFLGAIGMDPIGFIPVSAKTGENIAKRSDRMRWFDGRSVIGSLDRLSIAKAREKRGILRFPIQDMYNVDGKDIIVGQVEAGSMAAGDRVLVMPDRAAAAVKSIEVYAKPRKRTARKGEAIGITLDPVSAAGDSVASRGKVICKEGDTPSVTELIDATIFWASPEDHDIRDGLVLRCATQEVPCRIERIVSKMDSSTLERLDDLKSIKETEVCDVVLRAERRVVIDDFSHVPELGRFALEKRRDMVAGGIVRMRRP